LSPARRFVGDLLYFAQKVPTVPVQRRMHLAPVAAARMASWPRPGWCALFTKAYALVTAAHPELRRAYLSFPWPHLYEHTISVVSMAVGRTWAGEDAVLFAQTKSPDQQSLMEIDIWLRRLKEEPLDAIGSFRRALRITRWPRLLRRAVWWLGLNLSGAQRARYLGTFGVSVYAALGSASLHPLSPLTTTLNYGVIESDGSVDVRLTYDHRVLDGATVARALADLEVALKGPIVAELNTMTMVRTAS
jgi:hypothetical protein